MDRIRDRRGVGGQLRIIAITRPLHEPWRLAARLGRDGPLGGRPQAYSSNDNGDVTWNVPSVLLNFPSIVPGIAPHILKRIGEPYLSRRRGTDEAHGGHAGLGLGVFIARTLLERTGARVSFTNRTFPDHGAVVQIVWPRIRFEGEESLALPAD